MFQPATEEQLPPQKISSLFPHSNIRNIRLFYILTATNNAWFIGGNWIFFWTRFMTYGQLGILDASAFAFGLIMEVPSGAISDLIGKRKTINAAMLLSAIGGITMAFSASMVMLWIGFFIMQLGWALYSGAAESLVYDTLVDHNKEEEYDKVASTSGTVSSIASIVAILFGGILYAIYFRLSHLAWGLTYLLGFLFSLSLVEPKADTEDFNLKNYFLQLKNGTIQLFKPAIRPFIVIILFLLGADYLYGFGLLKPAIAISFGFFDKEQAIIFSVFGILGAFLVRTMPSIRKNISDKKGLFFLATIMGVAFMLTYFPLGYFGLIPMLLIALSGQLALPWVSVVINKEISSQYRATTLSTVALITKIPYVLLAIIAGKMMEKGTLNIFNLSVGLAIVTAVFFTSLVISISKRKIQN